MKHPQHLAPPKIRITYSQGEILALTLEGVSRVQIAKMLAVQDDTVMKHMAAIFDTLGVNNRYELLAWARARDRDHYEAQIAALGADPVPPPPLTVARLLACSPGKETHDALRTDRH